MISYEDCLQLNSVEELTEQIRIRRLLLKEVEGDPMTSNYCGILSTEISNIDNYIYVIRKDEPKQVIVMRKDLNMRKGKMVAQGSHASLGAILSLMDKEESTKLDINVPVTIYTLHATGIVREWLNTKFTKTCVGVDSEEELNDIYNKAKELGLPCVLITDSGQTEFGGVQTKTAVAIGPWFVSEIDSITGHLKLL